MGFFKMPWQFISPSKLKTEGVLGINRRNAHFILPLNPRRFYPRVDDKLNTKWLCDQSKIPIPYTYLVIERFGQLNEIESLLSDLNDFVIKPAKGAAGRGIMVIIKKQDNAFILTNGDHVTIADVKYHISSILSGLYSLGGQNDRVIIEQRVIRHPFFDAIAVGGTPDIRVIVHLGKPVMSMLRLPTKMSGGRANLHQGAIAAAIDTSRGITFGGVWQDRAIDSHPDTGNSIIGIKIPMWQEILKYAASLFDILELGYFGVDFVIDMHKGPLVLEANARPGLAIQIANRSGLLKKLISSPDHKTSPSFD